MPIIRFVLESVSVSKTQSDDEDYDELPKSEEAYHSAIGQSQMEDDNRARVISLFLKNETFAPENGNNSPPTEIFTHTPPDTHVRRPFRPVNNPSRLGQKIAAPMLAKLKRSTRRLRHRPAPDSGLLMLLAGRFLTLFLLHTVYVVHRRFALSTNAIAQDFGLSTAELEMVGYNPEPISGKELSTSDQSEAGLASGIATRAIIQPLDVLKIRFQLQEEPIGGKKSGKYRGVIQSIRLITREEGLRAFWKGHVPAQGLSAAYGLVQFSTYEWFSKQITLNAGGLGKAGTDFLAGGIAGSLAMTAAMPLDVIRTRLVAQAQGAAGDCDGTRPVAYRGTLHAMVKIGRLEGAKGFFRGWLPSVAQVAPYTGLQFWFYNAICKKLDDLTGQQSSKLDNFVSGAAAGTLAKTVLYPLDMVRHRLQMNGFQRGAVFGSTSDYSRGMIRSVLHIVKREGMLGLFKGLWPSQIKAAANSGFAFLFYELFCDILRARKEI